MPPRTPTRSVCTRCLIRRRLFSTNSSSLQQQKQNDLPPPPPQSGYARLSHRGLISITGADSTTFLQGLITQNMLVTGDPQRSTRRTGFYTAFLNAQGRVLNDAFIYPSPNGGESSSADEAGWIIEVDKNEVSSLLKHLKRHKLRAKLKLRALEDGEQSVWSTWNDQAEPKWAAYNLESESPSLFSPSSHIAGCIDTRAPGFGSRLVTPGDDDLRKYIPDESKLPGSEVQLPTYTLRRMIYGVAEGQGEIIRESALPLECNLDMMRGVDFRKGCYVGQELTIRTHHTGVVRKRILPVQLYSEGQDPNEFGELPTYDPNTNLSLPPAGANIFRISARKGRSAGKFLNGIGNVGLALCRLEMMTDIILTEEGTQYTPDQEFKVSLDDAAEGEEVKIKALVPPWTRDFILSGVRKNTPRVEEGYRAREMVEELEEEEEQRKVE